MLLNNVLPHFKECADFTLQLVNQIETSDTDTTTVIVCNGNMNDHK